jgi:hypothetical protein
MSKKQKQPIIRKQAPWIVTPYTNIHNKGEEDEFEDGFLEFSHCDIHKSYLKEISWVKGTGPYKYDGYRPPTLIDIWELFKKYTPGTTGFSYKNWHMQKHPGCFMYVLADPTTDPPSILHKDIVGDKVSRDIQDFAAFLWMLDNIEREIEESKPKQILFDLSEERKKRDAV